MSRNGFLSENYRHSPDGRGWVWFEKEHFMFSQGEAKILLVMEEFRRQGFPEVHFREILKAAGSKSWDNETIRFGNFFTTESGRRAFGRLVRKVKRTKGIYRLNFESYIPPRVKA